MYKLRNEEFHSISVVLCGKTIGLGPRSQQGLSYYPPLNEPAGLSQEQIDAAKALPKKPRVQVVFVPPSTIGETPPVAAPAPAPVAPEKPSPTPVKKTKPFTTNDGK